jgi:hypothetical protein
VLSDDLPFEVLLVSQETLSVSKTTDTAAFSAPIDFMTQYNAMAFEALQKASGETTGFITRRLQKNMTISQDLMSCKHPNDVMEVWSNFYTTALKDYAEQTGKMFDMMAKAAEESKDAAKEVIEAGEDVLEKLEIKAA